MSARIYVERGTMAERKVIPLAEKLDGDAPYFSLILLPGQGAGHERQALCHRPRPRARALADAGSQRGAGTASPISSATRPMSTRIAPGAGLTHPRQRQPRRTRPRPRRAGSWPRRGASSASSRAAIPACSRWPRRCWRRWRTARTHWRALDIEVLPGISAMQAAAARLGAPLGGDFCAISLSDNLKPWTLIERRLEAACDGDFVIALYNPASRARPRQIHDAFRCCAGLPPAKRRWPSRAPSAAPTSASR